MHPKRLAASLMSVFVGTAFAQSSITMYGIVDAWVGQTQNKAGTSPLGTTGLLDSGGGQASRFGVRGTEDLGGGLRANFVLEQGISVSTGAITRVSGSDSGFNRSAYLGLTGGFGEIRGGRMLTAYDALRGSTNHLYDSSGFASTGQVWGAGASAANGLPAVAGSDYLARGNGTLYYAPPAWGPISGSYSYSADAAEATASERPRMSTAHIKYMEGPLRIGYSYQSERYSTGKNKFHLVAGHYNFGPARLVGALQRQVDERVTGHQTSKEWQLGVDVPLGAATLAIGYASSVTDNSAGQQVVDASGLSLMGTYDLSQRTRLYVAMRKLKTQRADNSVSLDARKIGIGMTHRF